MLSHETCSNGDHQWRDWAWSKAQFPTRGQQLQSVWTRSCEACDAQEVRRTRANTRPEGETTGTIIVKRPLAS